LRDDLLLELARRQPLSHQALNRIRGLESGFIRNSGSEIIALIRDARKLPPEQWPRSRKKIQLSPAQEGVVDALMALVRLVALENQIGPASLVTRKELERLVSGDRNVPVMKGWRGELWSRRGESYNISSTVEILFTWHHTVFKRDSKCSSNASYYAGFRKPP